MKLIKEKSFYLSLVALALPVALQDFLKFGLNLVDNIMVGMLSEIDLSAVNLANQPFFLFSMMIFGLVSGGTVLISQYYGKDDFISINKIIHITLSIVLAFTTVFAILMIGFPHFVMSCLTNDNLVIDCGVKYLKIVGWTYLLYGISSTLILILRSVRLVKFTLSINVVAFLINVVLDWTLIFGHLFMPKLGIEGAAFATLTARLFELIAIMLYINRCDKRIKVEIKKLFHFDGVLVKDFLEYGSPVFVNETFWATGVVIFSAILGRVSTQAVASSSIASSVEQFICVILFGIANATFIIVGNQVGAGKKKYAKQCADTLLLISFVMGIIISLILFSLRLPITNFYNIKPSTRLLTLQFMDITSIIICIDSISIVTITGILRGGGDTKFAMYVDVLALWLFALPLGILSAFVLHLPPLITYITLRSDTLIKTVLCAYRLRNDKWITDITR